MIFVIPVSYLCYIYYIITACDVYIVLYLMFEYVSLVIARK